MFILLSGSFPFNGAGEKIYDVISTGDYTVCHDLAYLVKNFWLKYIQNLCNLPYVWNPSDAISAI